MGKLSMLVGAAVIGAVIGYFIVSSNWHPQEAPEEGLRTGALIGGVIGALCGAFGAGKASKD
jgi:hypothetical protein